MEKGDSVDLSKIGKIVLGFAGKQMIDLGDPRVNKGIVVSDLGSSGKAKGKKKILIR